MAVPVFFFTFRPRVNFWLRKKFQPFGRIPPPPPLRMLPEENFSVYFSPSLEGFCVYKYHTVDAALARAAENFAYSPYQFRFFVYFLVAIVSK